MASSFDKILNLKIFGWNLFFIFEFSQCLCYARENKTSKKKFFKFLRLVFKRHFKKVHHRKKFSLSYLEAVRPKDFKNAWTQFWPKKWKNPQCSGLPWGQNAFTQPNFMIWGINLHFIKLCLFVCLFIRRPGFFQVLSMHYT